MISAEHTNRTAELKDINNRINAEIGYHASLLAKINAGTVADPAKAARFLTECEAALLDLRIRRAVLNGD